MRHNELRALIAPAILIWCEANLICKPNGTWGKNRHAWDDSVDSTPEVERLNQQLVVQLPVHSHSSRFLIAPAVKIYWLVQFTQRKFENVRGVPEKFHTTTFVIWFASRFVRHKNWRSSFQSWNVFGTVHQINTNGIFTCTTMSL